MTHKKGTSAALRRRQYGYVPFEKGHLSLQNPDGESHSCLPERKVTRWLHEHCTLSCLTFSHIYDKVSEDVCLYVEELLKK
jgi:hypothetical protein